MDDNADDGRAFEVARIDPIEPASWPSRAAEAPALEGLRDDDWRRLRHDGAPGRDVGGIDWSARTAAAVDAPVDEVRPVAPVELVRPEVLGAARDADGDRTVSRPGGRAARRRRPVAVAAAAAVAAGLAVLGVVTRPSGSSDPAAAPPVATTIAAEPATTTAPAPTTVVATTTVTTTATSEVATTAAPTTAASTTAASTTAASTTAAPTTAVPSTASARPANLPLVIATADLGDHAWWGEIDGGRVRLRGRVPSRAVADRAVATARANVGSAPVVDELVVEPGAPTGTGPVPLFLLEPISFAAGSAATGTAETDRLIGFARVTLFVQPSARLLVIGQSLGSEPDALAGRRAAAVADAVAGEGVARTRIVTSARPGADARWVTLVFYGPLG